MAGPNFFETINPTLAAQQLALQRQQALASSLMGQGMQPISPTQNAGRYVVPITPLQGLAKVGEGLVGALMQRKIDEKQLNLAQQQAQMLQSIFGGGQQPSQADVSQAALGQGAQQGDVGPTVGNAQRMDQINQQLPTQAQQTAAQGGNPMVLPGMSGPQSMYMYAMDPNAYMTAALKPYSEGPINVRPGGTVYDPRLHRPMFTAPNLPQGSVPIYGPNGEIIGSRIVEGAPQAIATSAGAEESGKFPYRMVTTPSGAQVPAFTVPGLMGQMPQYQGQGQQGQQGQQYGGGVGQSTVGKTYAEEAAKAGSAYEDELRNRASTAVSQSRMLNELDTSMDQFTPGKAAALRKTIAQWQVQMGSTDPNTITIARSGEVGDKLTGQLVSSALRQMSSRPSQMEFQTFLSKFVPNLDMTPQGAKAVIQFMRQQNNLDAQKFQQFQTWKRDKSPADFRNFDAEWNPYAATAPLASPATFPATTQPKVIDFGSLR